MTTLLFILCWSALFSGVGSVLFIKRKTALYIYVLIMFNCVYLTGVFLFARFTGVV